jgi:NAD(P)-dependent dehydrogenase (short-subunit alcohol dehydrogenase family)
VRVVIVGGSGGIGTEACAQLVAAGHEPIVVDRVPPRLPGIAYVGADAAIRGQVAAAIRRSRDVHGPPDALVNCAGVYAAETLDEFEWASFDHSVMVNVAAPIEATLAFAAVRPDVGRATVVNVGSAGARTPSRDLAYATTKAAIEGATRSLAYSLARRGIIVLCVAPGLVDTPMSRRMPPDRRAEHVRRSWLGRAGTAEEVAALVVFLATGKADLLTGAVINASAGLRPD